MMLFKAKWLIALKAKVEAAFLNYTSKDAHYEY